ncbi:helix-turn-helix domain-containing protein [Spirosoma linguale]|uniref:Transcriptional regulator, AraC family n=1 Tax=Spirosoma linguale (strain ATCC 33905 / DSM 74 / LMG 10896 / Claus 1) TaxID=504472 RepID=D2QC37_SPILD|nr:transcriptional regulator, AraC family [Spirosoma linguale DSM 74]
MIKEAGTIHEYHLNKNEPDKAQFVLYQLGDYLKKNNANTTRPHRHSYYQIIWFQSGVGNHMVDFNSYAVRQDSIFFVAKNQVHYFDANTDYRGYMLHFNESFLIHNNSEVAFFLKSNFFNNPYQSPVCYIDRTIHQTLETYLAQLQAELADPAALGKEELLRGYLKAFLIQLQRFKNQQQPPAFVTDEKRQQLLRYINLVDEHYTKGLSVGEYARLMHLSSRTLSQITGHFLNKTPSRLIQERIILEAQRLLLHSELNINQIGFRLGFDDPSYFVKYFKKHAGVSPSEFRRSIS